MANNGLLLAIEGIDGSGREAQIKLLAERLKASGRAVTVVDFPQTESPSSYFIKELEADAYLGFPPNPYRGAIFYALDYFQAETGIKSALAKGHVVIVSRQLSYAIAKQANFFKESEHRRAFYLWVENLAYQLFSLNRPNKTFVLDIDPKAAARLSGQAKRSKYLEAEALVYKELAGLFTKDYLPIGNDKEHKAQSIVAINNEIWQAIEAELPPAKNRRSAKVINLSDVGSDRLYDFDDNGRMELTSRGQKVLEKLVANSQSDVWLLKPGAFDRIGANQDLKVQFLDYTQAETPLKVNAANLKFIIDNISLLGLTQLVVLKGGLPTARLQTVVKPDITYYEPEMRKKDLPQKYRESQNNLRSAYNLSRQKIGEGDHSSPILQPLAVLGQASLEISKADFRRLYSMLASNQLTELRKLAASLNDNAQMLLGKNWLGNTADKKKPDGQKLAALLQTMTNDKLGDGADLLTYLGSNIRNEFDLVDSIVFNYVEQPGYSLADVTGEWSYDQQAIVLENFMATAKSRGSDPILQTVIYEFELLINCKDILDIQQEWPAAVIQTQQFSPRWGYLYPDQVEAAGMGDLYDKAFDLSLSLYSQMQDEKIGASAQYAVLAGHRQLTRVSLSANDLLLEISDKQSCAYKLKTMLVEEISQHHPLIGSFLG